MEVYVNINDIWLLATTEQSRAFLGTPIGHSRPFKYRLNNIVYDSQISRISQDYAIMTNQKSGKSRRIIVK